MAKKIIWTTIFAILACLLQSTVLRSLELFGAIPDLALGIVVYTACLNGTMTGQVSGFFSGLAMDLLSSAPLGFNSLVRTLAGALAGLLKGMFFLDRIFFPMLLCMGATLFKGICTYALHLIFPEVIPTYNFLGPVFWTEVGLNTLSAPFLFLFLGLFKPLFVGRRVD